MSKTMTYIALNGKKLNLNAWTKNSRVNVRTNRLNKVKQTGYLEYDITKNGPFIWATKEEYKEFIKLNKVKDEEKDEEKISKRQQKKHDDSTYGGVNLHDVYTNNPHVVCKRNTAGTVVYTPDTKDPRELPRDALQSLCKFHLAGIKGWATVTSVYDGDTIDLVMFIPLSEMAMGHNYKHYNKVGVRSFIHTSTIDTGFFAKLRCRFNGCDSMEKNYPEGDYAKKLTIDLYQRRKGHVWAELVYGNDIEDSDKFGRNLVRIYVDKDKKIELTKYLFNFNDPDNGIIVVEEYDGGKKSDYSKNLAKRSKQDTGKMKEILDSRLNDFILKSRNGKSSSTKNVYTKGVKSETEFVSKGDKESPTINRSKSATSEFKSLIDKITNFKFFK